MSKIVNLNRARKARARDQAQDQADANAVKFGRSKAERDVQAAREAKTRETLDQHKLDKE